ncbi:MAG: nucleotide sugar dehydrogenase [Sphingosinicella sp.]|uniref:nucleotide sugar dehydrogenase n=1 Tax=Sphingosinicella sp. TaxID=1917971 RepID=UPI0040382140
MTGVTHEVGVVGLGYVGLTLATAFADVGLKVLGLEKRSQVARLIRSGKPHFRESGLEEIMRGVIEDGRLEVREDFEPTDCCGIYIITVGTPLGADGTTRLDMITSAAHQVARSMPDGALVALRSTVKIGTSRNVVAPILAASGKRFQIAMCPERTIEGQAMEELRHLPQIIGADDQATRERASRLFSRLTAQVLPVSSLETAEMIKLADNTYRDLQFAFANEIARLCDAVGTSAREVISTGKMGYSRTNIAFPGLVGGPCLEKDPHILRQSALEHGIDLEITAAARAVNERQPSECTDFICDEMDRRGLPADAVIAVLGLAFKGLPETDDLRGSMALHVLRALKARRPEAPLRLFDPVVSRQDLDALDIGQVCENAIVALSGASAAVITNNHPLFATMGFSAMTRHLGPQGFVYDFWNHYSDSEPDERAPSYFAVGGLRRAPQ